MTNKELDEARQRAKMQNLPTVPGTNERNPSYRPPESSGYSGGGVSNTGGCFPSGTLITTPEGVCDIASLKRGDCVISMDPAIGRLVACRILATQQHKQKRLWLLSLSDSESAYSVRTTAVHSFFADGVWKRASRIHPGESVLCYETTGTPIERTVIQSEQTNEVEDVYNLIVEAKFNFLANGTLAHSFSFARSLKQFFWSLYGNGFLIASQGQPSRLNPGLIGPVDAGIQLQETPANA